MIFLKIARAIRKILFAQNPPHSCQPIRIGRCRPIRTRLALGQSHRRLQGCAAANQLPLCANQSLPTFRCRIPVPAASQPTNELLPVLLDAHWLRPRIAASDWLPVLPTLIGCCGLSPRPITRAAMLVCAARRSVATNRRSSSLRARCQIPEMLHSDWLPAEN